MRERATADEDAACKFAGKVMAPIIAEGGPIGAVFICSRESQVQMGELELKLAETAAGFLAKQMERQAAWREAEQRCRRFPFRPLPLYSGKCCQGGTLGQWPVPTRRLRLAARP